MADAPAALGAERSAWIEQLSARERFRDTYRAQRDPVASERLLWRAQTVRHLMHVMPGQSILEIGAGNGDFARTLHHVTRGENPIVAATFAADRSVSATTLGVETVARNTLPGELAGRSFDCVVGMDMLDAATCARTLDAVHQLLVPGGQLVFFETNPWNPLLRIRRRLPRVSRQDPRGLVSRPLLYELLSDVGFIRVFAVFTDFVYAPLTRWLIWLLRNVSIVAENTPGLRAFAGAIVLHAQKPPRRQWKASRSLCDHPQLFGQVSVVVPCHNEEMNIGPLVTRLRELYGEYLHEIIPVDDNSRDATAEVMRHLARDDARIKPVFRTPPNGVGRALRDGYAAATGRWILSMDCDFQHLLPEVRDLFDEAAEGHAAIVGSRFSRHSVLLNYPFQKIVANRAFHMLARLVLLRRFRDLTNNLKLLRRDVVGQLLLRKPHFAVNAETGFQPLMMGYEVREVAI